MKLRCTCLLLGLVAWLPGCGSPPPPQNYDAAEAMKVLTATLDAWKEGQAGALATRQPPIRFEDEDCRNGWRLVAYRLESPSTSIRPFDDVAVHLSLRDQRGREVDKPVVYQVCLEPQLAVLRND